MHNFAVLNLNVLKKSNSNPTIKALMIDASNGFYRVNRYDVGVFWGLSI